jgi:CheY-like chemotaxis protein
MDIQMPIMNGYEVAQALEICKMENSSYNCITAGTEKEERKCIASGMND